MSSGTDYVGMVNEKVAQNPVIVFSKTYCPCEQQGWGAHVAMPDGTVAACRQHAAPRSAGTALQPPSSAFRRNLARCSPWAKAMGTAPNPASESGMCKDFVSRFRCRLLRGEEPV